MDPKSATRTYLLKPAAMAATVGAGMAVWRPGAQVVVPGYGNMPLPLVAAAATFVAGEACALINEYLFPHIPLINMWEAPAHSALNIGVQTAVVAGTENFLSPGLVGDVPLTEIAVFAAGAEVLSSYVVDDLFIPMYNKWTSY